MSHPISAPLRAGRTGAGRAGACVSKRLRENPDPSDEEHANYGVMKQIFLDREALRAGLDGSGTPTPDTPVAVVAATPDQLTARHGLELQRTYDDLGRLVLAVLESASGTRFTLERHDDDPRAGTTIALFEGDVSVARLQEVLDELRVEPAQVVWRYPSSS